MQKVSDKVLEFDRSFVQELMNQPATNSTNMKIAKEMLKDSIAEDLTSNQKKWSISNTMNSSRIKR